jgi:hypothetical protein
MKQSPKYDDSNFNGLSFEHERYQIAAIPIVIGVRVGQYHQTKWDRVEEYNDIDPPYYVMPLLSGLRVQIHVAHDGSRIIGSNGAIVGEIKKFNDIASILKVAPESIYEAVWRRDEGVCYITDMVMSNGIDISEEPFSHRYDIMNKMPLGYPVKLVPIERLDTIQALEEFMSDKRSAVIRAGNHATKVSIFQFSGEYDA